MHFSAAATFLIGAVSVAAQMSFPAVCTSECTPFGTALISKCMVTPSTANSMDTSLKIAACFCEQYAAGPGQICVTCIGNQPSLAGKNSTVLFTTLATQCTNPNDPTFSAAAATIDPIVRDAVVQNVVSPSSATTAGVVAANNAVPASVTAKTTSGSVSRWASSAALGAVAAVFVTLL
ncbi:hypothetical protein CcCBS67573_g02085 [Chytriomyces confervae]|uniref:Extracellular membrane protein CFEM domain-containing protein n=1 Tax=Chytriomyces confervae TaxID=246404 RepID=A0A507FNL1_9FUNG|nr:hypothetical protein HDU80_002217 [Chytriomyces hyalinus]TPX76607.1 hypothetical protein CcCBS67573_g02085 [Chytriomyces confervae]